MPAPRIERFVSQAKRKPNTRVDRSHEAFIRKLPCVMATINLPCGGCDKIIEAAHVRKGTDGGISLKPSARYLVPLCHYHHQYQHVLGEVSFWRSTEIAVGLAEELYRHSGDETRAIRAIERARVELRRYG